MTDELSGLYSRRYFETRLAEEWARHLRYGAPLSVALFDLDHFKRVNDTLGHGAGDLAIRRFGEILRATVRASDLACRYGGEEFAVLFPETSARAALAVADRVRRTVEREAFASEGRPFRVTVSAGVADTDRPRGRGPPPAALPGGQGALRGQGLGPQPGATLVGARKTPRQRVGRLGRRASGARTPQPLDRSRASGRGSRSGSLGRSPGSRSPPPRAAPSARRRGARRARRAAARARAPAGAADPARSLTSAPRPRAADRSGRPSSAAPPSRPASPIARRASVRDHARRSATPSASGRGAMTIPVSPLRTNSSGPPGVLGRQDGLARQKRLERHVAEVLARGGHRDDAGLGVEREQRPRRRPARQTHAPGHAELAGAALEPLLLGTTADEDGARVGSVRQRLEEQAGRFQASRRPTQSTVSPRAPLRYRPSSGGGW